jgi:hypothetical protein
MPGALETSRREGETLRQNRLFAQAAEARPTVVSPDGSIVIGLLATIAAVLALIVTQSIDFSVYNLRIAALDSDVHASIFGVASLAAQGAAALAATARAARSERRTLWLVLATLLSALLVFRILSTYEGVLLLPPVAVIFVLLWDLTSDDPSRPRALVRGALVLLVFSFVVHAVGPRIVAALGDGVHTWPYQAKGILKHTTEMAGWMLVATGVVAGTRRNTPRRRG